MPQMPAAIRTVSLLVVSLAMIVASHGRSEAVRIPLSLDGCPSILQESVYAAGFYSKSLPALSYFTFQDTVCRLEMYAGSLDFVLPLQGESLEAFIIGAELLVSGWNSTLEAAVRADTSLVGNNTQVIYPPGSVDRYLSG